MTAFKMAVIYFAPQRTYASSSTSYPVTARVYWTRLDGLRSRFALPSPPAQAMSAQALPDVRGRTRTFPLSELAQRFTRVNFIHTYKRASMHQAKAFSTPSAPAIKGPSLALGSSPALLLLSRPAPALDPSPHYQMASCPL